MMSQEPKVSIVMSCYNHAAFVREAVESAVHQTYKNIEIIVIDDGSTDDSQDILTALQEKYGFYLELRTNHGLVATLNYALKNLVNGKYVCILDSDDYWALDKVKKQVAHLEQNPECGLCHTPVYFIDEKSTIISDYNQPTKKEGDIFELFLMGKTNIADGGVMVPLNVYQEVGYYDESIPLEDYQLWLKILSRYPACYLNEYLAYYRMHTKNTSNDEHKMLGWEEQVISKWEDHPSFKRAKPYIYLRWFSKFALYNKKKAFKYLLQIVCEPYIYTKKEFYKGMKRWIFYRIKPYMEKE